MDLNQLFDQGGDEEPTQTTAAYNKQSVTQAQLVGLLSVIGNLSQSMRSINWESDNATGGKKCGGVTSALEATILKATDRIDDILDEKDRWDTKGTDSISDMNRELVNEQIATLRAQRDALNSEVRPALIFKPRITFIDGLWWAVHGDTLENRVVGSGETPQAAVLDFENNYRTATEPKKS